MANYRQIHTKIWKDGWFLDLCTEDKLLFIYLFSNERASLAGLYDLPIKVIVFETGIPLEQVKSCLEQFEKAGKVRCIDGWVWIPNLIRYNARNIESPKIQVHLKTLLAEIPNCGLKQAWIEYYNGIVSDEYRIDTLCIPNLHEHEHEHEQEQEIEQENEHEEKTPSAATAPPSEPKSKPKKHKSKEPSPKQQESRAMFSALANLCQIDLTTLTDKQRGALNTSGLKLRKADATPADMEPFATWWYANDWRGKKGDAPRPAQVRETWGKFKTWQEGGQQHGVKFQSTDPRAPNYRPPILTLNA